MRDVERSGHNPSEQKQAPSQPSRGAMSEVLRIATAEALAASLCTHLRVTARWSPGTLRLLLGNKAVTP